MANRIVSVHTGIYGMGIYAIMLPSSGFSVAHYRRKTFPDLNLSRITQKSISLNQVLWSKVYTTC